jgi:hypothetical protein
MNDGYRGSSLSAEGRRERALCICIMTSAKTPEKPRKMPENSESGKILHLQHFRLTRGREFVRMRP